MSEMKIKMKNYLYLQRKFSKNMKTEEDILFQKFFVLLMEIKKINRKLTNRLKSFNKSKVIYIKNGKQKIYFYN